MSDDDFLDFLDTDDDMPSLAGSDAVGFDAASDAGGRCQDLLSDVSSVLGDQDDQDLLSGVSSVLGDHDDFPVALVQGPPDVLAVPAVRSRLSRKAMVVNIK